MDISVVIPLLNEDESLPELCEWIARVMVANNYTYEVLFIDDGSTDNSWKVIEGLAAENPNVRGIKFRRNYGKSAALNVGFKETQGDIVITMDADLQDSPDEIPELKKKIDEGFDLISGWKAKRYDPITKTVPTKLFNWATRKMSGIHLNDFNCGLKAYKSDVVKAIEVYGEMHRYIPVIAKNAGFKKIGEQVVQHRARKYGTSKFGLNRFVNGFLDLLSITYMAKFSKRPMHFFGSIGSVSFIVGFILTMYLLANKAYHSWFTNEPVRDAVDNPWFYLALTALIVGVQLFLAGFLGEMISRSAHDKDNYLIADKVNLD
jgi:glycosyltransferase involved in cell wall biosynthesis